MPRLLAAARMVKATACRRLGLSGAGRFWIWT